MDQELLQFGIRIERLSCIVTNKRTSFSTAFEGIVRLASLFSLPKSWSPHPVTVTFRPSSLFRRTSSEVGKQTGLTRPSKAMRSFSRSTAMSW